MLPTPDREFARFSWSGRRGGQWGRSLLTFYDFPAEHWRHLRTTNIIESPFATVRLRQRVTKGAGSRTKALMMAFKLLAMAEVRAPHHRDHPFHAIVITHSRAS